MRPNKTINKSVTMSKSAESVIFTGQIATIIGWADDKLSAYLKSKGIGGELVDVGGRGAALNMYDIYEFVTVAKMPAKMAMALLDHWREASVPASQAKTWQARATARKTGSVVTVAEILSDKPIVRNMIAKAQAGEVTSAETANKFGLRIEGECVWLAPSHHYLAKLADIAGHTVRSFSDGLLAIGGGERVKPKKFGGKAARSISVPIEALLDAIKKAE